MRTRTVKLPKRFCRTAGAQCPYLYRDTGWSIQHCEHPTVVRRHGDTVDNEGDPKTGWPLRLPDCPISGRILTEEGPKG